MFDAVEYQVSTAAVRCVLKFSPVEVAAIHDQRGDGGGSDLTEHNVVMIN